MVEKFETNELEKLDELSSESIEQMKEVQPIEVAKEMLPAKKVEIDAHPNGKHNLSFRGGMCDCSCNMSCTVGR